MVMIEQIFIAPPGTRTIFEVGTCEVSFSHSLSVPVEGCFSWMVRNTNSNIFQFLIVNRAPWWIRWINASTCRRIMRGSVSREMLLFPGIFCTFQLLPYRRRADHFSHKGWRKAELFELERLTLKWQERGNISLFSQLKSCSISVSSNFVCFHDV